MIGFLSGKILQHVDSQLILNVGGVGYRVITPPRVLANNSTAGQELSLFIHTHVRDDQITLFGFETSDEQVLFELLLSVSGIGPKSALAILGIGSAAEIREAIRQANLDFFQRVPGVGKKSAQRLIVDLKEKLGGVGEIDLIGTPNPQLVKLTAALKSMGFTSVEISSALRQLDTSAPLEAQLRQTLKAIRS